MYLVTTDHFQNSLSAAQSPERLQPSPPPPQKQSVSKKTKNRKDDNVKTSHVVNKKSKQRTYNKWLAIRTKLLEANIVVAALRNMTAKFLCKVLPYSTSRKKEENASPTP